jgi:glycosyltransferase involved in cell wall biosynthesis
MKLIIINYSMSPNSLVFAHQRDTAIALSQYFESVIVFTPENSSEILPKNVRVNLLEWRKNSPVRNAYIVLKTLVPHLISNRKAVVFTHMTDVHAALISPITSLFRIRHILWYAHATNSIFLIWSSFFVNQILSSTSGSCNLKLNSYKIKLINQGISQEDFPFQISKLMERTKLFYYGRLDQSKNIHLLLELIEKLNHQKDNFTLDIFGKPTNRQSEMYLVDLRITQMVSKSNSSVKFHEPIERKTIPSTVKEFDIFLNLFSGSLDKTLIEATFMGKPVVTWNQEYCREFGTWSGVPIAESLDFISEEILALQSKNSFDLRTELERRLNLGLRMHSFAGWITRLASILQEDMSS